MSDDLFSEELPPGGNSAPASESATPQEDGPAATRGHQPLADRLRPSDFDAYAGQEKLLAEGAPLRKLIDADRVPSMILWGPPGSGKTTLASLIARVTSSDFIPLSAVTATLKDVRAVIGHAKINRQYARRTILFIDEIHRFNKSQQDAFLPHVESGLVTLIGATTENPSFSVIGALLSRCRVFTLASLERDHLLGMLRRGVENIRQHEKADDLELQPEAADTIVRLSDGDARRALGTLEVTANVALMRDRVITPDLVMEITQRTLMYDRSGEEHYNLISALHKVIRSSDPHGAIYWCERIIAGGEDPRFVLRRLIRVAAEDIGLADPRAVEQAIACATAYERLGSPEGDLFMTQLAVYLALAPKSNALYRAQKHARALAEETGSLPVPLHLRNAPTKLMKAEGYSEGYTYDHDAPAHFAPKQGLPDAIDDGRKLYEPSDQGFEQRIRERLKGFDDARNKARREAKKK